MNPNSSAFDSATDDDPVLERVGRVARVVLDPHLAEAELGGEAVGAHQRREPGAEVDRRVRARPAAGRRSARCSAGPAAIVSRLIARRDRVVVVGDLERAEAPLAREDRGDRRTRARTPDTAGPARVAMSASSVAVSGLPLGLASRRALERLEREDRSSATHRSGIGTWLHRLRLVRCSSWLPRRLRACPSAALDERVFAETVCTAAGARPDSWPSGLRPRDAPYAGRAVATTIPTRPARPRPSAARASRSRSACPPATRRRRSATIVATVRRDARASAVPLVDEVVVIDDGSTDATAAVAALGGRARRRRVDDVLPECRAGIGQGQRAVEVALRVPRATSSAGSTPTSATSAPHFVTGLLGPLLDRPRRRVREGRTTAGRSTASRPAAGASPSSSRARCSRCCSRSSPTSCSRSAGEYAGRRDVLEALPFVEGWGVEIGLLVDIVRALRARRGRAGRPRRARAPQPPARRARPAGARDPRRPRCGGPVVDRRRRARAHELVRFDDELRARQPVAGRGPRAPADRHRPRVPRASSGASSAA